jgi:4-hydroxybenzoate polyprenyltransferase
LTASLSTEPGAATVHLASPRRPIPLALLVELRPKQWLKNCLLFFGLIYSLHLTDLDLVARALLGFAAFCCISSAGYVFNDFRDLESDLIHPTKRFRPLASGELPRWAGGLTAVVLLLAGLGLAWSLGPSFTLACLAYLALTIAYSLWLKNVVIVDLFALAAGFVLRVVAGSAAIAIGVSPWLYVCTVLGSLLVALGKRRSEGLAMAPGDAQAFRASLEHYTIEFLDRLIVVVSAASLMAYSLYTFSADNVPKNHSMMLTIPIVLYGLFRYLYLVQVRGLGGSPEDLLLGDHSLLVAVAAFLALSAAVLYLSAPGS